MADQGHAGERGGSPGLGAAEAAFLDGKASSGVLNDGSDLDG